MSEKHQQTIRRCQYRASKKVAIGQENRTTYHKTSHVTVPVKLAAAGRKLSVKETNPTQGLFSRSRLRRPPKDKWNLLRTDSISESIAAFFWSDRLPTPGVMRGQEIRFWIGALVCYRDLTAPRKGGNEKEECSFASCNSIWPLTLTDSSTI